MPVITITMTPGRSVEQKRDLIASVTRETARAIGCSATSVQIVLTEIGLDDWGSGGLSLAEKKAAAPQRTGTP